MMGKLPYSNHRLGDDFPDPTDADGRSVAGSNDFAVIRSLDGHRQPADDDTALDADTYRNPSTH